MSNRTVKLIPYSKEQFPQAKFVNGIPIEDVLKKYSTFDVFTDEKGKPTRVGEDYFIDEQGNHLRPKELPEVVISAPAHLSDEEFRQYLLNSQNFNRRYGLPVDYDNMQWFTYDNGITGKRNVNYNTYKRYTAADNISREFNKQMDTLVAGATGIMLSPYLLGSSALAVPSIVAKIAPGTAIGNFIGESAGAVAGIEASNLASKKLTGKTVEEHINNGLGIDNNSFTGQWITPMLNPAGYWTIAARPILYPAKTAITQFADNLAKQYIKQTNPGLITRAQKSLKNQWTRFNQIPETVKSPVKINDFQKHPVSDSKYQYRVNNIESFSAGTPKDNRDLNDIYVPREILAKRQNNAKHAIDTYKKRLNSGGIKLVYDRGTERYRIGDIRVTQSDKDILASIKALEADNPIPHAADYYDLKKDLLDLRESYVIQDNPRSLNEIKKELYNREGWEDLTSADFDEFVQYIVAKPSPKLKNWLLAKDKASRSMGYSEGNFTWAPNKETLKQILNNYFSNLDTKKVENILKYQQNILPHEFEHTFQDAFKLYKKYYSPKHLIPKIDESTKLSLEQFNLIADEMSQLIGFRPKSRYFLNPTELLGRGTQIKNWLGITDPQYQLTVRDLKEAAKYYTETGLNNNMAEFFNAITDWDKAAKFLSYATAAAGVGSTVGLNNKKLVKKSNKNNIK